MARIKEAFDFGPWAYNVDKAREILAAAPRDRVLIDIIPLADLMLAGEVTIDRRFALTLKSLVEPLITVPAPRTPQRSAVIAHLDAGGVDLPIDGWHRAYKAFACGLEELEAYPLTRAEAYSIRFQIPEVHGPRTATAVRELHL